MHIRDQKEIVYNHIKQLWLPYTVIDVGWWYQIAFPGVPSGKVDYVAMGVADEIVGGGNVLSALTDMRDIGRYVAKIIVDDRTLNRMVLAYNITMTQNQIYNLMEDITREKLDRKYVADETIYVRVLECRLSAEKDPGDSATLHSQLLAEYRLSWGVRGDNNPDYAKYLGYLTSKELYPDFQSIGFRDYLKSVVEGTAQNVYTDDRSVVAKQAAVLKSE
ncbi:isoflavone reductase family protein [Ilyonectria robusta]